MLARAQFVFVVCLVALLGCATGGLPRRGWTHHRVGEVDFYSGASPRETQQLVEEFAKFRVVTGELTSAESVEPKIPTKVYLFPDQRSFYRHVKHENSAGIFRTFAGEFTIALNANAPMSQETLFHEYTHLILANTGLGYPLWYHEGFAELMSTMKFVGTDVQVGRVSEANIQPIAAFNRWVPLNEIVRGEIFKERDDIDRLHRNYAQAWLFVHYLNFGDPQLGERIGPYVLQTMETGDQLAAFQATFGVQPNDFAKTLREYVRQQKISFRVFDSQQFQFPPIEGDPEEMTPAATAARLARMCWMLDNEDKAQELRVASMFAGEPDPFPAEVEE
jgi:hypothetical protein